LAIERSICPAAIRSDVTLAGEAINWIVSRPEVHARAVPLVAAYLNNSTYIGRLGYGAFPVRARAQALLRGIAERSPVLSREIQARLASAPPTVCFYLFSSQILILNS
jgi:hypothetical protein